MRLKNFDHTQLFMFHQHKHSSKTKQNYLVSAPWWNKKKQEEASNLGLEEKQLWESHQMHSFNLRQLQWDTTIHCFLTWAKHEYLFLTNNITCFLSLARLENCSHFIWFP